MAKQAFVPVDVFGKGLPDVVAAPGCRIDRFCGRREEKPGNDNGE